MTDVEAAWVAGLMEGEAHFAIITKRGEWKGKPHSYPAWQLRVNMTDQDVVERVHAVTGIGRLRGPFKQGGPGRDGHKPVWSWVVNKRADIRFLIERIRPFMGRRRGARIDAMLAGMDAHPPPTKTHGKRSTYASGCRCDPCRDVQNSWMRAYKARRRAQGFCPD